MMQTIAVFDFDGTITYHDTLIPFLRFACGTAKTLKGLACLIPSFAAYELGFQARQSMKEKILTQILAGMSSERAIHLGEQFANNVLPHSIRPNALNRIKWHQTQGHRCILISANIPFHLIPWANSMGFHDVISSQCEVSSEGILTGRLEGKNCWGPEKLRRLQELIGLKPGILYAYGDSLGDLDVLKASDYIFYRSMPLPTASH